MVEGGVIMRWWQRHGAVTVTPETTGEQIPDGDTVPVDGVRWIDLLPTQELPIVPSDAPLLTPAAKHRAPEGHHRLSR